MELKQHMYYNFVSDKKNACLSRKCIKHILVVSCFLISMIFLIYLPSHQHSIKRLLWNNTWNLILPDRSTTLIAPKNMCQDTADISLIVFVYSSVLNKDKRQTIRNTWAQDIKNFPANAIQLAFFVGRGISSSGQEDIDEEVRVYGDIIQEDFIDSYKNLTLKSLRMLKWFSFNCKGDILPFLLKADDDMFINFSNLFNVVIKRIDRDERVMIGNLIVGAVPIRNPSHKWFVPPNAFTRKVFPNYLTGSAYLMSGPAAVTIYEDSGNFPLFPIEDVFITGILPEKMGIKRVNNDKFTYNKRNVSDTCLYRDSISSHNLSIGELKSVYNRVMDQTIKCQSGKKH